MANPLELKVIFSAVDKFVRPVNAITGSARAASKELKGAEQALKSLHDQQKLIDNFRSTNKALGIDAAKLEEARARVRGIADAMAATTTPSAAMQRSFAQARDEAAQLSANVNRLIERKQRLRQELSAVGLDTKQLASGQRDLKARIDAATASVKAHGDALEAANKKMQRLKAAQADLAKSREMAGKLAGTGAKLGAAGAATSLPIAMTTQAYADFETAMLGVARQVEGARDENGKYTATYHEMGAEIKAMSERLPLTANEIAKIVEGGARMGIQGKANILTFSEMTAVMSSAFDLPVEQVGEDIGTLSKLYKIPIKDIQQLGDTINWLDDNALSKGGDIIDVMKRIAGTAEMVKMNFGQAAALGSTFLSLGARAEVAASASNAMIRELSIATMQTKRFQGGLAMLKLSAKDVQLGMNKDATGTILKVLEAIKALPEQKQLEAATRLFGKEFGDDAAKLASNLEEYRRQLKLVRDEEARGSMQREADTRNRTINARMTMAKNALGNVATDLGETLRPELVATLERTLALTQAVRAWGAENPRLAAGLMSAAKGAALLLTVLGVLTLGAAAVLGPLALVKFSLVTLGLSGVSASGALAMISGGFMKVGSALLWVGRLAMAHPVLALITLLAAGAVYVWQNWDSLGPKFMGLIDRISGFFGGLKDRALTIGSDMIDGMIAGFRARWEALKSTVTGIGDSTVGWLKERLGIRSPSRVFAELGGYTMQGFEQGLQGGADGPLSAVGDLAKKLAGIGAGVVLSGAAGAADLKLDTRPPLTQAAMMAQAAGGGQNVYNINISVAPGTDTQGLAALVAREIERIEARRASQRRSALRDPD